MGSLSRSHHSDRAGCFVWRLAVPSHTLWFDAAGHGQDTDQLLLLLLVLLLLLPPPRKGRILPEGSGVVVIAPATAAGDGCPAWRSAVLSDTLWFDL